jgi:Tol biopolymer transport system component
VRKASVAVLAVAAGLIAAATAGSSGRQEPTGTIFFQRFVTNPVGYQIFRVNADGTHLAQLTRGPARIDNAEPEPSPDGRSVVFQHGPHNDDMEIFLMRSDGGRPLRLTRCRSCHWSTDPSFSADGGSIVFARWDARGRVAIWRIRSDGTRATLLLHAGTGRPRDQPDYYPTVRAPKQPFVDQPALSPDGRFLAYRGSTVRGQTAIFVATADGRNPRAVTPPEVHASRPRWSPDGRLILFYTTDKDDLQPGRSANLEVIRPDGSGLRALTHDTGGIVQNYEASWSPDGNWITFARETHANNPPGQHSSADIYIMRADGTDVRRLVGVGAFDEWPSWGR